VVRRHRLRGTARTTPATAGPDDARYDIECREGAVHRANRDGALEASLNDVLDAVLDVSDDEVVHRAGDVRLRSRCDVVGEVASVGRDTGPSVALDLVVSDDTGHLLCHFMGRDALAGVQVGTRIRVAGRLVTHRSRRCLLNPAYELVSEDAPGRSLDAASS
jgi:hypothetical protein